MKWPLRVTVESYCQLGRWNLLIVNFFIFCIGISEMSLKWWREGIPSRAFGGVALVLLFVLFGDLFDWFSCLGAGIYFFGVLWFGSVGLEKKLKKIP